MTTDTFSIAAAGDDGTGYVRDNTRAWPPVGTWVDEPGGTRLYAAGGDSAGYSYRNNAFFRWDTSSIPDAALITAAVLQLYIQGTGSGIDATSLLKGDYYDFGGEPTVAGDAKGFTSGDASIFTPVGPANNTAFPGGVQSFPLTSLSGINKTGYTGIRVGLQTQTPGAGADYSVWISSFEAATQEPRLQVTYDMPARVSQQNVDALVTPTSQAGRASQQNVDVIVAPTTQKARLSAQQVEVVVRPTPYRPRVIII